MASEKSEILVVDDEEDIRALICGLLNDEGYKTRTAASAEQAYKLISESVPHLIILDIWLHGSSEDGLNILKTVKKEHANLPVIMISGHGTIETAVAAIKDGAYDFLEKPFKGDRLLLMIRRALENASLKQENESLKQKVRAKNALIGSSQALQSVMSALKRVAPTNSRVLLTGEQGTGKDVAARFIYDQSQRSEAPFFVINCAALDQNSFARELFGSESEDGYSIHKGILEKADGGTIFLDEVSDMPMAVQAKILHVLQDQTFIRVDGRNPIGTDVRIIASTNRDLRMEINEGRFRDDLYYRLNVVPIHMPPLRERLSDIPELVEYFSKLYIKETGVNGLPFSERALLALKAYSWPGNIRQLKNVVERAIIMSHTNERHVIDKEDLPLEITSPVTKGQKSLTSYDSLESLMKVSLKEARDLFEKEYLRTQMMRFDGNISKTAKFVGMERSALHRKLKLMDLSLRSLPEVRTLKKRA